MMYDLVVTPHFKRSLRLFLKRHPELKPTIESQLRVLQKNPSNPSLRTHKLSGRLKGCLALSITYNYRLVFEIDDEAINLLAIGSHDEAYR